MKFNDDSNISKLSKIRDELQKYSFENYSDFNRLFPSKSDNCYQINLQFNGKIYCFIFDGIDSFWINWSKFKKLRLFL